MEPSPCLHSMSILFSHLSQRPLPLQFRHQNFVCISALATSYCQQATRRAVYSPCSHRHIIPFKFNGEWFFHTFIPHLPFLPFPPFSRTLFLSIPVRPYPSLLVTVSLCLVHTSHHLISTRPPYTPPWQLLRAHTAIGFRLKAAAVRDTHFPWLLSR